MRPFSLFVLLVVSAAASAEPGVDLGSVSAQTCGKLFGAKQTAMRLRDGGFSEKQTLEETLNRPEWRDASKSDIVWAVRIVDEVYAQPGIETSQVVRECRARVQGMSAPDPIQLPADLK